MNIEEEAKKWKKINEKLEKLDETLKNYLKELKKKKEEDNES